MDFDEFVDRLHKIGWRALGDAQHTQIRELWEELIERGLLVHKGGGVEIKAGDRPFRVAKSHILRAIQHIRWRLELSNEGYRIAWSLQDRSSVSYLCIEAAEYMKSRGAWDCRECGYFNLGELCEKCHAPRPAAVDQKDK